MKYRNRYHENTRVVRVTLGQYGLLKEVAGKLGISSLSEALGVILAMHAKESPEQMPMFSVQARPEITFANKPPGAVFEIKTRGGVIANGRQG